MRAAKKEGLCATYRPKAIVHSVLALPEKKGEKYG